MSIRKLEADDIEQVYKLLNELYDNKIEYDIFAKKYNEVLKDKSFYGIIMEENSIIVGVLISRIINRLVKSKDILFIDDLIVDKKHRNNGIGKLLLKNAIEYAKEQKCQTLELTSYIDNESAHKLYEQIGFEKRYFGFKKVI